MDHRRSLGGTGTVDRAQLRAGRPGHSCRADPFRLGKARRRGKGRGIARALRPWLGDVDRALLRRIRERRNLSKRVKMAETLAYIMTSTSVRQPAMSAGRSSRKSP